MALSFLGTDKFLAMGSLPSSISGACSISLWAKFTSSANNIRMCDLARSSSLGLQLYTRGGGKIGVDDAGGLPDQIETATVKNDGEWHHAVVTRDGIDTYSLYVDGVFEDSISNGTSMPSYTRFFVGARSTESNEFEGDIDDVRVYDRELLLSEIQSMFACRGVDNILYGLYGRWVMNDGPLGTGVSTVRDLGINGIDGSVDGPGGDDDPEYVDGILSYKRRFV